MHLMIQNMKKLSDQTAGGALSGVNKQRHFVNFKSPWGKIKGEYGTENENRLKITARMHAFLANHRITEDRYQTKLLLCQVG